MNRNLHHQTPTRKPNYLPGESTSSSSDYYSKSTTGSLETKNGDNHLIYSSQQNNAVEEKDYEPEYSEVENTSQKDYEIENDSQKEFVPEKCEVHHKKLKFVCWNDQKKICSRCVIFGQHKNSKCPDIRELNALNEAIGPTKKRCEDLIPIIEKFWEKAEDLCEEQREATHSAMKSKFNDLRFILKAKEAEFMSEIDSFYDREKEKLRLQIGEDSFSMQLLKAKIADYETITRSAKPFELLEENLGAAFEIIQETLNLKAITKMEEVLQQIKSSIDLKLCNQFSALEKIQVFSEDFMYLWQEVDLKLNEKLYSRQELKKYQEDFKTSLQIQEGTEKDITIDSNQLVIEYPFTVKASMNLDVIKDIQDISSLKFKIKNWLSSEILKRMSQEDVSTLCFIRSKFRDLQKIEIDIEDFEICDDDLLDVFSYLFWRSDSLTSIHLTSYTEEVYEKSILYLAEMVLPDAKNLKTFFIHFDKCSLTDDVLNSLSSGIALRAKDLTSFHFVALQCSSIIDLRPLFACMPNLESFVFKINSEELNDRILGEFTSNTLPSLKKLKSFQFSMNNSKVTDSSLRKFFSSFPEEWFLTLNQFQVNLRDTSTTDLSLKEFVDSTLGKFKALQMFEILTDHSNVSSTIKAKISIWGQHISSRMNVA